MTMNWLVIITIPAIVEDNNISYRVISIGAYAFEYCSLTSITIPDSVTSIGEMAFHCCTSLKAVIIPDSVTNIEREAFQHCKSLTSITYKGTIAQWQKITLDPRWNYFIPATAIHCTDGDVEI